MSAGSGGELPRGFAGCDKESLFFQTNEENFRDGVAMGKVPVAPPSAT